MNLLWFALEQLLLLLRILPQAAKALLRIQKVTLLFNFHPNYSLEAPEGFPVTGHQPMLDVRFF
jgi:hypothetical protein